MTDIEKFKKNNFHDTEVIGLEINRTDASRTLSLKIRNEKQFTYIIKFKGL